MGLFARKLETPPAAPAPTRARNSVTSAELNAAISAVCDVMADCSARQTLEALHVLTAHTADDNDVVKLDGQAPVTLIEFDDALAEARKFDLPAGTLSPLTRIRELLARAEKKAAAVGSELVTRAEFDALANAHALALVVIVDLLHDPSAGPLGSRLEAAAHAVEFKSASAGIQALLGRLEKARSADGARQRRRASNQLRVLPGTHARNF
jgi:hypothetical protein